MAIKNYACKNCSKATVCKINDTIVKFSADAKNQLGVDLQILNCLNYEGNGEIYDEI